MWVIVGLGNPGEEYAQTRHNIGFQCVNELARRHGLSFDKKIAKAREALEAREAWLNQARAGMAEFGG